MMLMPGSSADDPYVEFPVDLIVDVHWKRPTTPPPTPEECGSVSSGGIVHAYPAGVARSFSFEFDNPEIMAGLEVVSIEFAYSFTASLVPTHLATFTPPPHPWYFCDGLQVSSSAGGVAFLGNYSEGGPTLTGGFTDVIGPSAPYPVLTASYSSESYTGPWWAAFLYPSGSFPIGFDLTVTYFCTESP